MAKKRTKADRSVRQTEQLDKRVDRHPDEIEKKPSKLAPKSEPTVLIPIERQIQQRATNFTSSAEGLTVTTWTIGFKPSAR
jgi:hypothetical protein